MCVIKSSTWAEISLDNLKFNLEEINKVIEKNVKMCCVLKANAYGHGSIEVARFLEKAKVDYFAVARIEEGIELRKNGIKIPILILGYTKHVNIQEAIELDLTLTVFNLDTAIKIDSIAKRLNTKAKVHLKIDTGMNRIGFKSNEETMPVIKEVVGLKNLYCEGIFTHYATADESDKTEMLKQLKNYNFVVNSLKKDGINFDIRHTANSAAIIDCPDAHFDMVRAGIILYGCYPSDEVKKEKIKLRPVMKVKTVVTNVKKIEQDDGVSYGLVYRASKREKIVTIAIGYADGYTRMQKNPKVSIKGNLLDVVGRICMDQVMVKVDDKFDVEIGDEVVVFGEDEATAQRIAKDLNTISYEVLCMVSRRVERIYKVNNVIAKNHSYLIE